LEVILMPLPGPAPTPALAMAMAAILSLAANAEAAPTVPSFFSENMILQRDRPVPLWGWADDDEPISIIYGDHQLKTVAKEGRWKVELPAMPAGGPITLAISGTNPNDTLLFSNCMVGEVWIVCGQSNAGLPLHACDGYEDAVASRDRYPNIRVVELGRRNGHQVTTPQDRAYSFWGPCKWQDASYLVTRWSTGDKPLSQTVPGCMSGLSYFFARELSRHFDGKVPVGIVQLGAILPVQTWVSDATVAATPLLAPVRGKGYPNATSAGFNDQVSPLAPFPVRGVVYYQGEMNAGRGNGPFYEAGLTALIRDWRTAWHDPELPFLIVQLAGFIKHLGPEDKRLDMDAATLAKFTGENVDHGFCHIRQAQYDVSRAVPRVGLAVTTDLGDPYDIHPRKKLPVAERLLLQARRLAYGEQLAADSPYPQQVEFAGNECRIRFGGVGGGLVAKGDTLEGFELSPDGKTFASATAVIHGDSVIVTSPDAKPPTAVRYAWAGWPKATLANKEGLPATPFRFPQPQ
jgi:sialate O-acetylesterase